MKTLTLLSTVLGLLIYASPAPHADDFCSDVPKCAEGKTLTLIPLADRLDCAMFTCVGPDTSHPTGTAVTSDVALRKILESDPSVACNADSIRVLVRLNNHFTKDSKWTCVPRSQLASLKRNDTLMDEVETIVKPLQDGTCIQGFTRVRFKASNTGEDEAYSCVPTNMHAYYKAKDLLVSENDVSTSSGKCENGQIYARVILENNHGDYFLMRWRCISPEYYQDLLKKKQIAGVK